MLLKLMIPIVCIVAVDGSKRNFWTNKIRRNAAKRLRHQQNVIEVVGVCERSKQLSSYSIGQLEENEADSTLSVENKENENMLSDSLRVARPLESFSKIPCTETPTEAAAGLPVYVRTHEGAVQMDLPSDATVADLRRMTTITGGQTTGILTFQGNNLVDDAMALSDVGIVPESVVEFRPRSVLRVTLLSNAFTSTFIDLWTEEIIEVDISAIDFDGFLTTLRLKILEKIRNETPEWETVDCTATLTEEHLWLRPVNEELKYLKNEYSSVAHLQSTWGMQIPDDWSTKMEGKSHGAARFYPPINFRIWKSADET